MLILVNKVKKDRNKYKSIKKTENKIVEILLKSKSWNLPKTKSRNLFNSKKVQNIHTIK